MKKLMTVAMIAMFGFMLVGAELAEAKRFGMGSSFGKQRMSQPKSNSFSQRQAVPKKSAAAGQRGSARTGMMGMLGGLALGGMLGAMFFGGAFEGINLFDILMIGGIVLLLFFFLRKRAPAQQYGYASAQPSSSKHDYAQGFATDDADILDEEPRQPAGTALRPEIDAKHFVPAAKDIYVRMQKAWDTGDIEDVRKFCTPDIADRIASDMSPNSNHTTEVATLNAEIADRWIESELEWVAVNFTAMLREKTTDHTGATIEDQAAEVNEVWIFQHAPKSDDPTWYLAGIQQAA